MRSSSSLVPTLGERSNTGPLTAIAVARFWVSPENPDEVLGQWPVQQVYPWTLEHRRDLDRRKPEHMPSEAGEQWELMTLLAITTLGPRLVGERWEVRLPTNLNDRDGFASS